MYLISLLSVLFILQYSSAPVLQCSFASILSMLLCSFALLSLLSTLSILSILILPLLYIVSTDSVYSPYTPYSAYVLSILPILSIHLLLQLLQASFSLPNQLSIPGYPTLGSAPHQQGAQRGVDCWPFVNLSARPKPLRTSLRGHKKYFAQVPK